jgi:photosynthetic reaction center cytochrome c subunit
MSRKLTLALGTVALLVAASLTIGGAKAQSAGTAPAASNSSAPKKAEDQFKNIQTLKGIPADQLIPTMQFISASLGVECEYCHVQGAFEKDEKKPKETARKMMAMMFAINKDNFEGHREVTCYSCHRGGTDPVSTPIIGAEEAVPVPKKPEGAAKETGGPTADQLFDKFVQASGGAAAIEKVASRVWKGTIDVGGKDLPVDVYAKDPLKRASFMHMPEGDSVTAFDGHEGWLGNPGRPLREMHGPDLDGAALDADLHLATHLKQMFSDVEVRGTEKIGDRDAYLVVGRRAEKTPLRLYFDVKSGLLLRMVRYGETALGRLPTQIDYADYREASGVKIPFRWTLARPSGRFTIQASEVQQNVPVDDAKFAKPATPEPPKTTAK